MNFDFLKDLRGLGHIYENCSNAEKLAMTMPVQSVFTARKSAELLAKFIFLAAHNEQMETMSFVDILNDPTFREFVHDREIMSAFHYIRKSGNRAVHGDDLETSEDAIVVLEDLHFVAGETACMLGLIKGYPSFSDRIETYLDAIYSDEQRIEEEARKMFLEYTEKYDAQVERNHYYQNQINGLINEFEAMTSWFSIIPGDVDLSEAIEFMSKPKHESTIKPIQAYFGFLGMKALKHLRGESSKELKDRKLEFSAELTIYGENGYTTTDLQDFINGVLRDLPSADGFRITSSYYGPSIALDYECNRKDRKYEFYEEVKKLEKDESFSYIIYDFLYNQGEGKLSKYEDGKWIDLQERYTQDIIDKDLGDWWCWNLDLVVDFDFEKHPDILEALHNCVRENIPTDQVPYCENDWKLGDVGVLCSSIAWYPKKLRIVQDFLDKINDILRPIIKECDGSGMGKWYITGTHFAIATWEWTQSGFRIIGTEV